MSEYTYPGRRHGTFDALLQLADPVTTTVKTPVVGQVGGSDQILNVGKGQYQARLFIDVTDLQIPVGDELYRFVLLGSTESDMSSNIVAVDVLELGANAVLDGDLDLGAARYVRVVNNFVGNGCYPYWQIQMTASAVGAVSVTWGAWLSHDPI